MNKISVIFALFSVLCMGTMTANAVIVIDEAGDTSTIIGSPGGTALLYGVDDLFQGIGNSKVFLTLNQTGGNTTEKGYNTEGTAEFQTIASGTTELPLAVVPAVTINGTAYREFAFAVNQTGGADTISINQIQLFMADVNDLTGYDVGTGMLPGASEIFDWVSPVDGDIQVNDYNPGLNNIEMMIYIPDALFTGGSYIYFYTDKGVPLVANDGPDKWVADKGGVGFCVDVPGIPCDPIGPPQLIPEPHIVWLLSIGFLTMGLYPTWRRRIQS